MAHKPMTLNQMLQTYQQLTSDYQARRIEQASYSAALMNLKAVDPEGRWWTCTKDGGFLWYDGKRWLPGQPVGSPSRPSVQAAPAAEAGSHAPALKKNPPLKGWRRIAATPFLAMLPGAVIGGIWFFYTLLQLITGGLGGVDFLTPAILTGVPLLLWLLRKPLDKLLLPLQKFHGSFPFAVRLGAALAVPMLFGCGCSMISTSGYSAIHFSALISTLFSYFLLRTPAPKRGGI
ncbi:MAG: hypothetical protein IH586_17360 [Anaerolineaceae bacterium]|nr:hypothetical protein [Anaerolineaceae bacterium]